MGNSAQRPRNLQDAESLAADTDRIQLAQLLGGAAAQGKLPMNEYEARLTKAYQAQTYSQLDQLRADLPGSSVCPRRGGDYQPAPSSVLLGILTAFQRRGRWNIPKRLTMFALFGGGVVDLRYGSFTSPDVEINAYSIMGGQTVLLPPEINVSITGHGVMGAFDHDVDSHGAPGAPTVTIRGLSLWGAVRIKRKQRRYHAAGP